MSLNQHPKSGAEILAEVRSLRDVPTLSVILQDVLGELGERRSSLDQLTLLIRRDQVLCAKVLRTVNSAYYARENPIGDLKKALHFLGEQTLRAIVVGSHSFKPEDLMLSDCFNVLEFWPYCFATGVAAEMIGNHLQIPRSTELFTAGLLHDMGKLVHLRMNRDSFRNSVELSQTRQQSLLSSEQELGNPGHAVLGEVLLEGWNLPQLVRKVGRYYHRDVTQMPSITDHLRTDMMIATLAIEIVRSKNIGCWGDKARFEAPPVYREILSLSPNTLQDIGEKTFEKASLMSEIFRRSVLQQAA